tara:strand:+ start:11414 stop:11710 length:297 start_codon:yes stop_codon:yes gene_type:complete
MFLSFPFFLLVTFEFGLVWRYAVCLRSGGVGPKASFRLPSVWAGSAQKAKTFYPPESTSRQNGLLGWFWYERTYRLGRGRVLIYFFFSKAKIEHFAVV